MSQPFPDSEPGYQIRSEEGFSFADGPVDIFLGEQRLSIINPGRDLDLTVRADLSTDIGCLVIDPETFDVSKDQGFKALRDGETIVLGRASDRLHRFDFSDELSISREHVILTRQGNEVYVKDLGSMNGTYLGRSAMVATIRSTDHQPADARIRTGLIAESSFEPSMFRAMGNSIASERHPEYNDDAFFADAEKPAVGVFDGVGGRAGSGRAARIAAESAQRILQASPTVLAVGMSMLVVKEALESAHNAILETERSSEIATTATVAKLFRDFDGNPYAAIASVGDSRAYLWHDNQLSFLTLDKAYELSSAPDEVHELQKTLALVVDLSLLSSEEAAAFRSRNMIDSALGLKDGPMIYTSHIVLQPGDKILVTSDGIHDNLTTDEIKSWVAQTADSQIPVSLTSAAKNRSQEGRLRSKADDMTATVLAYYG